MPTIAEKRARFRALHETGCFVIPNPWDIGSARYLQSLGFPALATTSSGFAWTTGRPDNAVTANEAIAHAAAMAAATDVPLNLDFEDGHAPDLDGLAGNVTRAAGAGVAGISIEDSTGDQAAPLYELTRAIDRIKAARAALDWNDPQIMLIGRAEGMLVGRPDLGEILARLKAYAAAGADCLYAPGLKTKDEIVAVVEAVAPKPVNVLLGGPTFTVAELAALGVRRISVGGALARVAWGAAMRAAEELATGGTFGGFAAAVPFADIERFFIDDRRRR